MLVHSLARSLTHSLAAKIDSRCNRRAACLDEARAPDRHDAEDDNDSSSDFELVVLIPAPRTPSPEVEDSHGEGSDHKTGRPDDPAQAS